MLANLGAWNSAAADYAQAIKLGASPSEPSWWGVPQLCFYAGDAEYARALASYRAGDYDRARALLDASETDSFPAAIHLARPLSVLVHHVQGEIAAARQTLALASDAHGHWIEQTKTQATPFPWFDRIESYIILKEAHIAILAEALPDDGQLEQLEQTALTLIRP